jgi:hypothetical protein
MQGGRMSLLGAVTSGYVMSPLTTSTGAFQVFNLMDSGTNYNNSAFTGSNSANTAFVSDNTGTSNSTYAGSSTNQNNQVTDSTNSNTSSGNNTSSGTSNYINSTTNNVTEQSTGSNAMSGASSTAGTETSTSTGGSATASGTSSTGSSTSTNNYNQTQNTANTTNTSSNGSGSGNNTSSNQGTFSNTGSGTASSTSTGTSSGTNNSTNVGNTQNTETGSNTTAGTSNSTTGNNGGFVNNRQAISNEPLTKTTQTKGHEFKGGATLEYKGLGEYVNFNVPKSDASLLMGLVRNYLLLNGIRPTTPNDPSAEVLLYVTVDVFGIVRSRFDAHVYNQETLKAETSFEMMAFDRTGRLIMAPRTSNREAQYAERYLFWAGPFRTDERVKRGDGLLVDFTDVDGTQKTYGSERTDITHPFGKN